MTRTILVTGANRGIGLELVKQYAMSGDTLLACCRNPDEALELQQLSKSYDIQLYQLDVNIEQNINRLSEQLNNVAIDILINNAGIAGNDIPFGNLTYADLLSTINTNAIGPIMIAQALLKQVIQGNNKIIVNMTSVLGSIELNQDSSWGWLPYRVSKSALNSATRTMAQQLKTKKITVIAMNPGWVQTDMGGENADLTVKESVSSIRKIIDNLSSSKSGLFLSYNGESIPW